LFANYNKTGQNIVPTEATAAEKLNKYFSDCECDHNANTLSLTEEECLRFWEKRKVTYSKLIPSVLRVFPVPASSAPVERVFSHGGIFVRPHQARTSDKLLSTLVFLKCNSMH
jgi:hypothetical protein